MKKGLLTILAIWASTALLAQEKPFVVPAVEGWKPAKGTLRWNQLSNITYNDAELQDEAQYLAGFTGNIPATLGKGGSVSLQLCTDKKLGQEGYQLTVTPNAGYQFENMTVTDENSNPINVVDNAFRMPASNVTITATFTAIPFTVTVPESFEHGTVECDKETADYGETVTLTVTPDEGYELNALTVTVVGDEPSGISTLRLRGGELVELTPGDEPNTYTFEMPAAPVTVNATFVETIITAVTDLTKTQPTGQRYNIMGQPVGKDYKGIVIEDGKKKVVK